MKLRLLKDYEKYKNLSKDEKEYYRANLITDEIGLWGFGIYFVLVSFVLLCFSYILGLAAIFITVLGVTATIYLYLFSHKQFLEKR